ncbi:RIPP2 protein, partial [Rhinopomastus cyanomelas]|nr:RIPP2 protein [Rhinopomastus cyanomelas]
SRSLPLWRPWLTQAQEGREHRREQMDTAREAAGNGPDKAPMVFQHPVRLLWPRSKCFDYLYGVGETLLRNFPVQATLCLYDDSGSEGEDEEEEEDEED